MEKNKNYFTDIKITTPLGQVGFGPCFIKSLKHHDAAALLTGQRTCVSGR